MQPQQQGMAGKQPRLGCPKLLSSGGFLLSPSAAKIQLYSYLFTTELMILSLLEATIGLHTVKAT